MFKKEKNVAFSAEGSAKGREAALRGPGDKGGRKKKKGKQKRENSLIFLAQAVLKRGKKKVRSKKSEKRSSKRR